MGNPTSKLVHEIPKQKHLHETKVPSSPICTPSSPKMSELDPRSPSLQIIRTPIQFLSPAGTECGTPDTCHTTVVLKDDPRSPTTEFIRTPIVVDEQPKTGKLHNKNLEKVRKQFVNGSPAAKRTSPNNNNKIIAPKLLESSPIVPKPDSVKRRSLVGVLETNLDYTETDLDTFVSNKSIEATVDVYETQDSDPRSPTSDFLRTPMQVLKKIGEIDINKADEEPTTSNSEESVDKIEEDVRADVVLPDLLLNNVPDVAISEDCDEKKLPIEDFDTKLTNLIYEDDDTQYHPRTVKSRESNRTPLGVRNSNHDAKKSTSKLKVHDKPTRNVNLSKIPVFLDKRPRKTAEQCENTPPRDLKQVTRNNRNPRWDSDKTLII